MRDKDVYQSVMKSGYGYEFKKDLLFRIVLPQLGFH